MRHRSLLFLFIVVYFLSFVVGSYDTPYGIPEAHGHHTPTSHSAGSYYHYHVPVVGQQQHYQPPPYHHQQSSNEWHYLIPILLLLFLLPFLFLSLLPLLLLPLGLPLLALLMPGGMMMMMMMMEMMEMMSPARIRAVPLRKTGDAMRSFEVPLLKDVSELASDFIRALDLDSCPERFACEMGATFSSTNSSKALTSETILNYVIEQALPKGAMRKRFRLFRDAYRRGYRTGNDCSMYNCSAKLHPAAQSQQDNVHTSSDLISNTNSII